jgi:hypothetical protein
VAVFARFRCGLLLALLLAGCTTSRFSTSLLHPPYTTSPDGLLHYRLPLGWFDASSDSQATGHAVLLIRNDYGATIAVDEVYLDSAARILLHREGLFQAAQLMLSLTSWERGTVLTIPPHRIWLNGLECYRYTMEVTATHDTLDVTLLNAGEKVYAVSGLLSPRGTGGFFERLQDSFITTLRW